MIRSMDTDKSSSTMAANVPCIAPWESFDRGDAATACVLCLRAKNSRKHNASDGYAAAIWMADAHKACEQDAYRQYRV